MNSPEMFQIFRRTLDETKASNVANVERRRDLLPHNRTHQPLPFVQIAAKPEFASGLPA